MIINATIISKPDAGEFPEKIFDIQDPWNLDNWTWIKFEDEEYSEWCGQFRGSPKSVEIDNETNSIIVLTSAFFFMLDKRTGELKHSAQNGQYMNLTIAPNGCYIIADYYNLAIITSDLSNITSIESPILMDMIKFEGWYNNLLEFTCDEFTNWDRHLLMTYNHETNEIKIKE